MGTPLPPSPFLSGAVLEDYAKPEFQMTPEFAIDLNEAIQKPPGVLARPRREHMRAAEIEPILKVLVDPRARL